MENKNLNFYRAFEDVHRGSRELIKSRLQIYIPFVLPLLTLYGKCQAIDLGCGRGEWLELLMENNFQAAGVDLDVGMLAACEERNLSVCKKDAITALRELPDESQSIISGFHIAEHLPFDALSSLLKEAFRTLKPGGLLILETPNPENLRVATLNFYLDPTHQKPIPPQLLHFMMEFQGFIKTKILRLQEPKELVEKKNINLMDVIGGASPDYAVIAQKGAPPEILSIFDEYFNKDYGIPLDSLASSFEQRISSIEVKAQEAESRSLQADAMASHAEFHAKQAETTALQAEFRAQQSETLALQAEARVQQAETIALQVEARVQQAETIALQAESNANTAWNHYRMIAHSHSWKMTYPLRLAGKVARWFVYGSVAWLTFSPSSRPRRVTRSFLLMIKRKVKENYRLESLAIRLLARFPKLKDRLKRIGESPLQLHINDQILTSTEDITLSSLSPNAKRIYTDLQVAIENREMGDH